MTHILPFRWLYAVNMDHRPHRHTVAIESLTGADEFGEFAPESIDTTDVQHIVSGVSIYASHLYKLPQFSDEPMPDVNEIVEIPKCCEMAEVILSSTSSASRGRFDPGVYYLRDQPTDRIYRFSLYC